MGTAPCHGHVVEATRENLAKMGYDEELLIKAALDNGAGSEDIEDFDDALNFLGTEYITLELAVAGKKAYAEVFRYDQNNGDRYDNLEDGCYLIFDEDDLYEKKTTPLAESLKCLGAMPQEKQWTNFG